MSDAAGDPMRDAIADIYAQVGAPDWAAPNLDGLADVLRDLSWLPVGEVVIERPEFCGQDWTRLRAVLDAAVRESVDGARPVVLA